MRIRRRAAESAEDRASLDRSLQKRRRVSEQYFNLIAGKLGKNYCPGRSWEAIGHLALRLVPAITVADLGAGEGLLSQLLAHRAKQVWCIDNSVKMIEVGTELAQKNGLANLTYKQGDIEDVPLPDKSVDLAILSQALHHAQHPQTAVNEAFRILKPGGQLLVLDLKEHDLRKSPRTLRRPLARLQGKRAPCLPQESRLPEGRGRRRLPRSRRAEFRNPPRQRCEGWEMNAATAIHAGCCLLLGLLAGCAHAPSLTPITKPATWGALQKLPVPPADRVASYGAAAQQTVEIRLPQLAGKHPVVLLLHGGCWQNAFDCAYLGHLAEALRAQGWATFNVEYRRLGDPGGGWPGTFDDVQAATNFVLAHATEWRLDSRHVVVVGHSAGGHLALLLAGRDPRITGVVGLAAITDLAAYQKETSDCGASAA